MELSPGTRIGQHVLDRPLGRGGMGEVWRARHVHTGRAFALKILLPDRDSDENARRRFLDEAKAVGALIHPGIVEVFDVGSFSRAALSRADSDVPYLVMELLDGTSLDALLDRGDDDPPATLSPPLAVAIGAAVARALGHAHARGLVHRDVKPANVFLHRASSGAIVPKLLDFGIAKVLGEGPRRHATTTGLILGSPAYMSPEQAAGLDVDPRSDVWALGVVLYRALSGSLPFDGNGLTAILLAIVSHEPAPLRSIDPTLSPDLEAIVARCLARERDDRWPSANALADALEGALRGMRAEGRIEAHLALAPVEAEAPVSIDGRRQDQEIAAGGTLAAAIPVAAPTWSIASPEERPIAAPARSRAKAIIAAAVGLLAIAAVVVFAARGAAPVAATNAEPSVAPIDVPSASATTSAPVASVAPAAPTSQPYAPPAPTAEASAPQPRPTSTAPKIKTRPKPRPKKPGDPIIDQPGI